MKLAYIPPGQFIMGSPPNERGRNPMFETQHKATLTKGFYMGTTPVTQAQWKAVMGDFRSKYMGPLKGDDLPVEQVAWQDAVKFCTKLSEKEGRKYRLPTEAEWEYACRAGTTTAFYTGDSDEAMQEAGWSNLDSGRHSHPVGQKKPNAWALYDMHGNVYEWCSDWADVYPPGDAIDPTGPARSPIGRVARGGSYWLAPQFCRAARRIGVVPDVAITSEGFRVVFNLSE